MSLVKYVIVDMLCDNPVSLLQPSTTTIAIMSRVHSPAEVQRVCKREKTIFKACNELAHISSIPVRVFLAIERHGKYRCYTSAPDVLSWPPKFKKIVSQRDPSMLLG